MNMLFSAMFYFI